MIERISTLDVRQRLGDLLNRVALRHDEFIIERKGKPFAALVPVEKLELLRKFARAELRRDLSNPKSTLTEEEVDALADEAKHLSRPKRKR